MTGLFESWFLWLEKTAAATEIRQSLWLYPFVQYIHIVGIVLLVGPAMIFDLRLIGLARRLEVRDLGRFIIPLSQIGFVIAILSGFSLFIAHATDWSVNPLFWLKITLIVFAALNAVIVNKYVMNRLRGLETLDKLPVRVRVSGAVSLFLWFVIIAAGRFLAYY